MMIRGDFVKRSVLQGVSIVITPFHRFHLTSKTLARGALRKNRLNAAEEKHLESGSDSFASIKSNVNFLGIESEEGVITIDSKVNSMQQNVLRTKIKEKFQRTAFGVIRYDCDNKLKFHGQYGNSDFVFPHNSNDYSEVSRDLAKVTSSNCPTNKNSEVSKLNYDIKSGKMSEDNTYSNTNEFDAGSSEPYTSVKNDQDASYIDQYYFDNYFKEEREHSVQIVNDPPSISKKLNFFDQNYFGDLTVSEYQKLDKEMHTECSDKKDLENLIPDYTEDEKLSSVKNNSVSSLECNNKEDMLGDTIYSEVYPVNTSDKQHMSNINSKNIKVKQFNNKINIVNVKSNANSTDVDDNLHLKESHSQSEGNAKLKTNLNVPSFDKVTCTNSLPKTIEPFTSVKGQKQLKVYSEESVDTAEDFVKNLQKQKEVPELDIKKGSGFDTRVDSKGFRILKNQVDDLSFFTQDEIINLLKQNILYSDDDLLILNKPYSLVMHESQTTKSPCLSAVLDKLANEMNQQRDNPKLYTVHRLDKETTGCLLLARNEIMAQNLKSLFAQRKIIKKYWILTSRVPDSPEGVIDIPIAEGSIDNKKRMVLNPEIPKDIAYRNHSKRGKQAVTSYKVLSESGNAALVEATPITGIKHQIRVHFGFGICCPILGDHKYSHLDKLAPQKLPSDILQRLHVRQSKVRYIPLHIHAKSVTIPGYFEGRDLYVKAPLPNHMKENLKRLKFKK